MGVPLPIAGLTGLITESHWHLVRQIERHRDVLCRIVSNYDGLRYRGRTHHLNGLAGLPSRLSWWLSLRLPATSATKPTAAGATTDPTARPTKTAAKAARHGLHRDFIGASYELTDLKLPIGIHLPWHHATATKPAAASATATAAIGCIGATGRHHQA